MKFHCGSIATVLVTLLAARGAASAVPATAAEDAGVTAVAPAHVDGSAAKVETASHGDWRGYKDPPVFCWDCHMWNGSGGDNNGHLMRCYCADHFATIHLNLYISNQNGVLTWGGSGHRAHCQDFVLDAERWYRANCRDKQGNLQFTWIDLNKYIAYYDGRLIPGEMVRPPLV